MLLKTNELGVATVYVTNAGLHPLEIPRGVKFGQGGPIPELISINDFLAANAIEICKQNDSCQSISKEDVEWLRKKSKPLTFKALITT